MKTKNKTFILFRRFRFHFFSISVPGVLPHFGPRSGQPGPGTMYFSFPYRFHTVFVCVGLLDGWLPAGCVRFESRWAFFHFFVCFRLPFFVFVHPFFCSLSPVFGQLEIEKMVKLKIKKKKTFRAFALGHFQFASTTVPSRHDNTTPSHRVSNREGRSNDFKQALTSLKA